MRQRRSYLVAATCCGLVLVYVSRRRRIAARTHAQDAAKQLVAVHAHENDAGVRAGDAQDVVGSKEVESKPKNDVLENVVALRKEEDLAAASPSSSSSSLVDQPHGTLFTFIFIMYIVFNISW